MVPGKIHTQSFHLVCVCVCVCVDDVVERVHIFFITKCYKVSFLLALSGRESSLMQTFV